MLFVAVMASQGPSLSPLRRVIASCYMGYVRPRMQPQFLTLCRGRRSLLGRPKAERSDKQAYQAGCQAAFPLWVAKLVIIAKIVSDAWPAPALFD